MGEAVTEAGATSAAAGFFRKELGAYARVEHHTHTVAGMQSTRTPSKARVTPVPLGYGLNGAVTSMGYLDKMGISSQDAPYLRSGGSQWGAYSLRFMLSDPCTPFGCAEGDENAPSPPRLLVIERFSAGHGTPSTTTAPRRPLYPSAMPEAGDRVRCHGGGRDEARAVPFSPLEATVAMTAAILLSQARERCRSSRGLASSKRALESALLSTEEILGTIDALSAAVHKGERMERELGRARKDLRELKVRLGGKENKKHSRAVHKARERRRRDDAAGNHKPIPPPCEERPPPLNRAVIAGAQSEPGAGAGAGVWAREQEEPASIGRSTRTAASGYAQNRAHRSQGHASTMPTAGPCPWPLRASVAGHALCSIPLEALAFQPEEAMGNWLGKRLTQALENVLILRGGMIVNGRLGGATRTEEETSSSGPGGIRVCLELIPGALQPAEKGAGRGGAWAGQEEEGEEVAEKSQRNEGEARVNGQRVCKKGRGDNGSAANHVSRWIHVSHAVKVRGFGGKVARSVATIGTLELDWMPGCGKTNSAREGRGHQASERGSGGSGGEMVQGEGLARQRSGRGVVRERVEVAEVGEGEVGLGCARRLPGAAAALPAEQGSMTTTITTAEKNKDNEPEELAVMGEVADVLATGVGFLLEEASVLRRQRLCPVPLPLPPPFSRDQGRAEPRASATGAGLVGPVVAAALASSASGLLDLLVGLRSAGDMASLERVVRERVPASVPGCTAAVVLLGRYKDLVEKEDAQPPQHQREGGVPNTTGIRPPDPGEEGNNNSACFPLRGVAPRGEGDGQVPSGEGAVAGGSNGGTEGVGWHFHPDPYEWWSAGHLEGCPREFHKKGSKRWAEAVQCAAGRAASTGRTVCASCGRGGPELGRRVMCFSPVLFPTAEGNSGVGSGVSSGADGGDGRGVGRGRPAVGHGPRGGERVFVLALTLRRGDIKGGGEEGQERSAGDGRAQRRSENLSGLIPSAVASAVQAIGLALLALGLAGAPGLEPSKRWQGPWDRSGGRAEGGEGEKRGPERRTEEKTSIESLNHKPKSTLVASEAMSKMVVTHARLSGLLAPGGSQTR